MSPVTTPADAPAEAGHPAPVLLVLLAAGAGSRYVADHHKLHATLPDGRNVAAHALAAAVDSAAGPVGVVLGATTLALPDGVLAIDNPQWELGQATSLQAAVGAAERLGVEAIVVGLADQPLVPPEAWRRVAASTSPIAVATYADTGPDAPRNPVRLHRSVWAHLPRDGTAGHAI